MNSTGFWDGPRIFSSFLSRVWKHYPSYTEISFGRERERAREKVRLSQKCTHDWYML